MALETLKDVKEIGGFPIGEAGQTGLYVKLWPGNAISFKLQDGPIGVAGCNGCQVDTIVHAAKEILVGLNKNHPCIENDDAIGHLTDALTALEARRQDRLERGVEGTDKH